MIINLTKKTLFICLLIVSTFMPSQSNQFKEIDELLKKADISNKKYENLGELKYAKKANILAKKAGNSERLAKSYYFMARSLYNLELQKKSLLYAQKAYSEKYTNEDSFLKALITELKAYNYNDLNLTSQSIKEQFKALKLVNNSIDNNSLELKSRVYTNIANYHLYNKKNIDSTFFYFNLERKLLKKLPEKTYFPAICEYYSFVGTAFLQKKEMDSALFFFEKGIELKQKYNDPVLYVQYVYLGDYYNQHKQYKKAEHFYMKSLKNMQHYSSKSNEFLDVYKRISQIAGLLGKKDEQVKYESLYSKVQNKALSKQNQEIDYALNIILNDDKKEYLSSKNRNNLFFFIGILTLIIFSLFLIKVIKKKADIINETTTIIQNKEEIIVQKTFETKILQEKMNDSYLELVDYAMKNSPTFYFRFQEIYPDFQPILLKINPRFRNSELVLCAYIFLGFTIKDIAQYTSRSINTVRNRKQNLRRKFNISTEQDMCIWLKTIYLNNKDN